MAVLSAQAKSAFASKPRLPGVGFDLTGLPGGSLGFQLQPRNKNIAKNKVSCFKLRRVVRTPKIRRASLRDFESDQPLGVHQAALKLCSLGEAAPCNALI